MTDQKRKVGRPKLSTDEKRFQFSIALNHDITLLLDEISAEIGATRSLLIETIIRARLGKNPLAMNKLIDEIVDSMGDK